MSDGASAMEETKTEGGTGIAGVGGGRGVTILIRVLRKDLIFEQRLEKWYQYAL